MTSDPPERAGWGPESAAARAAIEALGAVGGTAATAESLTGGLVSAWLTSVAGSSAVFRGGVVSYDLAAKQHLLGVPAEMLAEVGPVHADVAATMADGAKSAFGASAAVATTGVAGPQRHGGHVPGTVFVGWSTAHGVGAVLARFPGDRSAVRAATTVLALRALAACARTGAVTAADLGAFAPDVSDCAVTIGSHRE